MWIWFLTLVIGWAFGLLFGAWLWYPAYLQYLKWDNQIKTDLENKVNNDLVNEQFPDWLAKQEFEYYNPPTNWDKNHCGTII